MTKEGSREEEGGGGGGGGGARQGEGKHTSTNVLKVLLRAKQYET